MAAEPAVCVVGAGPVGLTAAYLLAREGVRIDVFEAEDQLSREWRASTFHPPTLELFDSVGLADSMLDEGLVADTFQIRDLELPNRVLFDLAVLADDTRFPFRLQYEQYKLSALVARALDGLGTATIHFNAPVSRVVTTDDHATVTVRRDGTAEERVYDLVIGADGSRSAVREALDIPFPGMTYPSTYMLLSVDEPLEDHISGLEHVNYIGGSDQHAMLLRIPDLWRVLLSVDRDPELLEPELITPDYVRSRLDPLIDGDPPAIKIAQRQIYRIHQRVADTFLLGRIVLVGDAAHINSPFGGLGLNSGIHDAFDLARSVSPYLPEGDVRGSLQALHGYGERRRQVAVSYVQAVSDENTKLLSHADREERRKQLEKLGAVAADASEARAYLRRATMINAVEQQPIGPTSPPAPSSRSPR